MKMFYLILILLLSVFMVNASYCYQETANISTSCGGSNEGNYSITPSAGIWSNQSYLYDEDYNTQASPISWGEYGFQSVLYANYKIPNNTISALIQVKLSNGSTKNISINDTCLNGTALKIFYSIYSSNPDGDVNPDQVIFSCWNYNASSYNTNLIPVCTLNCPNTTFKSAIFEEAIYWGFDGCKCVNSSNWIIDEVCDLDNFICDLGNYNISITSNGRLNLKNNSMVKSKHLFIPLNYNAMNLDFNSKWVITQ